VNKKFKINSEIYYIIALILVVAIMIYKLLQVPDVKIGYIEKDD
jgi:hypothetical protein